MKYKAMKPFYCPLSQKRIQMGESIEIPEKHLEWYEGYIEIKAEEKVAAKPRKKAVKS